VFCIINNKIFCKVEVKMNKPIQSKRKGSVLALVMVVLVIMLVMGVGLLSLGQSSRIRAARTGSEITARCAADAGLTKARFEMNEKLKAKPWTDSNLPNAVTETLPNCDATFSYTVTAKGSNYTLESVGNSGRAEKRIYATLGLKGLFDHAILAQNRLGLASNSLITGYNSLDPCDSDIGIKIGTLSIAEQQITLGPGSVVEGDAFCGIGGDPSYAIGPGGTIQGVKYAISMEPPMPLITAPPLPDMGGSLDVIEDTTIGPSESGTYTGINVAGDKRLIIDGGDVALNITGNTFLGNSAEILLKANSSLTLYTSGTIDMDNSAGFLNENTYCGTLKVFATDNVYRTHTLRAKSNVFGIIYAPDACIDLYPKAEIHGSVVASAVYVKSGAVFHYDKALQNVSANEVGTYFVLKRWHEE